MIPFAQIVLSSGTVIAWLVLGLLGGILAWWMSMRPGYGIFIDLLVGLVGAVVSGFVCLVLIPGDVGPWASIAAAFSGAFLTVFGARFFAAEPTKPFQRPPARSGRSRP